MPVMPWSNLLSVGVREIDDQHRVLVDILNRLGDVLLGEVADWDAGRILGELVQYTERHFLWEENLMRQVDYADVEAHLAEHRKLIERLREKTDRFERGDLPNAEELVVFVREWLTMHILKTDRQLAGVLNEQGIR